MSEIEQKLTELRDEHLVIAGKIKCLQEMNNLYYDLRLWLGDRVMSVEEIQKVRDAYVSLNIETLNGQVSYQECLVIFSKLRNEHSRLRDIARERKYNK